MTGELQGPTPFGDYVLIDRVGAGGMAELYRGELRGPRGFRREVAVKKILPQHADDDEFITMLLDEARISARLIHPNIGQVLNCGKLDGTYFIVMEYVHGHSLRRLLTRLDRTGDRLSIDESVYIAVMLLGGLDFAHKRLDDSGRPMRIVHRDVTPENILVSYDGDVKLIDFGIAHATGRWHKTDTGMIRGKIAYMSPEQLYDKGLDHRTDQYAAALVLYEMITGMPARRGETQRDVLRAAYEAALPFLDATEFAAGRGSSVRESLRRALAKDAQKRFEDCARFASDLQRIVGPETLYNARGQLAARLLDLFAREQRTAGNLSILPTSTHAGGGEQKGGSQDPRTTCEKRPSTAGQTHNQEGNLADAPSPPLECRATANLSASVEWETPRWQPQVISMSSGRPPLARRRRLPIRAAYVLSFGVLGVAAAIVAITDPAIRFESTATDVNGHPVASSPTFADVVATSAPVSAVAKPTTVEPPDEPPARSTPKRTDAKSPPRKRPAFGARAPVETVAVGTVDIACLPWCVIAIDGRPTGKTAPLRGYRLSAGAHTVDVLNPPSGVRRSREIEIVAGKNQALEFYLEPTRSARRLRSGD